ncbi:hypothetical protein JCM3775_000738 [Rhodotorula graminis]|uniref:Uncharacterized protein n=1 Tax=Rhodotorula graminis (strain WP1) TaxID=578459 RepID=A0A194SEF8_RHOGW|nr:uncharacterized protein RHOBADRAFT_51680 [Rhodotorula graminis WP1]KPV77881.1 hypothetical protein RHOBADRAFT_51680 [Rhodotorula graminis WP1]
MPPKSSKSAYARSSETVQMTFVDLVWMIHEVPLGTPNALPALGSPLPWYILPAPLAKTKCPWTRTPNDASRRLESIHREAARGLREYERAKRDAQDPAQLRAEANRKKKLRKLASKARKDEGEGVEAAAAAAADRAAGEGEGEGDEGTGEAATTAPKRVPTGPKCAYALPPYLSDETRAAFLDQYARVHAQWDKQRWDEADVVLPDKLKAQAVWGNAYIYPAEHKDDPQRGLVLNQDTLTFEYHTE